MDIKRQYLLTKGLNIGCYPLYAFINTTHDECVKVCPSITSLAQTGISSTICSMYKNVKLLQSRKFCVKVHLKKIHIFPI